MDDYRFDDPLPPPRKKTGVAFTGLILALVIVVAGGTFLLVRTWDRASEEDEDAPDVLQQAPEVNADGVKTRELVFYTSEGEIVALPSELAEQPPPREQPLRLPPELIELMESGGQPAETETSTAGETYSVQVGAFGEEENASGLLAKLEADGYRAYIVQPPAGGEEAIYRVRVGPFHDRTEAAGVAAELQAKYGLSPYIPH